MCVQSPEAHLHNAKAYKAKALKTYKKYQRLLQNSQRKGALKPVFAGRSRAYRLLIISAGLYMPPHQPATEQKTAYAAKSRQILHAEHLEASPIEHVKQHVFNKHFNGHLKPADVAAQSLTLGTDGLTCVNGAYTLVTEYPGVPKSPLKNVNRQTLLPSTLSCQVADVMHAHDCWHPMACEQDQHEKHLSRGKSPVMPKAIVNNYTILGCFVLNLAATPIFIGASELKQAAVLRCKSKAHPCASSLKLTCFTLIQMFTTRSKIKITCLRTQAYTKATSQELQKVNSEMVKTPV